jgi:hypothetical protein
MKEKIDIDSGVTVGYLRRALQLASDDDILYLDGLKFSEIKRRSNNSICIEFKQKIYKDTETGKMIIEEE